MRWIVAVLLAVHGLIHLMGFAKAFGYAELPQLTQPISREMGVAVAGGGTARRCQRRDDGGVGRAASGSSAPSRSWCRRRSSCRRGAMRGRARS